MPESQVNGWDSWGHFVLEELKQLNNGMENLREKCEGIKCEIAALKIKAGIWGAVGACIPILAALGIIVVKQFILK